MQRTRSPKATLLAVLCAGLFGYGLAYADKPEHAGGGGRAGQYERGDKGHGGQGGVGTGSSIATTGGLRILAALNR